MGVTATTHTPSLCRALTERGAQFTMERRRGVGASLPGSTLHQHPPRHYQAQAPPGRVRRDAHKHTHVHTCAHSPDTWVRGTPRGARFSRTKVEAAGLLVLQLQPRQRRAVKKRSRRGRHLGCGHEPRAAQWRQQAGAREATRGLGKGDGVVGGAAEVGLRPARQVPAHAPSPPHPRTRTRARTRTISCTHTRLGAVLDSINLTTLHHFQKKVIHVFEGRQCAPSDADGAAAAPPAPPPQAGTHTL